MKTPVFRFSLPRLIGFQFTDRKFHPYALAIGQAMLSWNYLQEVFCYLLCAIIGETKTDIKTVWYSQEFDRLRRKMLAAAFAARTKGHPDPYEKYEAAVDFLIKETNKLEDARNSAVHSPLIHLDELMAIGMQRNSGVVPHDWLGNPRAARLLNKDLLIELRWLRDMALALSMFGLNLNHAWREGKPSPGIPKLPTREDQKKPPRSAPPSSAKIATEPASIISGVTSAISMFRDSHMPIQNSS